MGRTVAKTPLDQCHQRMLLFNEIDILLTTIKFCYSDNVICMNESCLGSIVQLLREMATVHSTHAPSALHRRKYQPVGNVYRIHLVCSHY